MIRLDLVGSLSAKILTESANRPLVGNVAGTERNTAGALRDSDCSLVRILICVNLIRCDVVCGRLVTSSLFGSSMFLGNIAPTDYIRR